jgi:DNA-binding response OmpR family regulator
MSDLSIPELNGLRILVVEDERLIADMIMDALQDAGCDVIGPAMSLQSGEGLASNEALDGAFLDVNLAGKASFPIAQILMQREIPLAFLSGYGQGTIPEPYRGCPFLWKPFQLHQLVALAQRHFTRQARSI